MVCKNCGRQVVLTDRFCPDCGTPVVAEEPVVETPVEVAPAVEEAPKATKARKTTKKEETQPTEEKKNVTSSSLLQAISAARNNSKLANNEETEPAVEPEKTEDTNEEVSVVEVQTEEKEEAPVVAEETVETKVEETTAVNTEVVVEVKVANVKTKKQPKEETENSTEEKPFIPTVTATKKAKGFGIASIIISSITMLVLAFVITFAVLFLTAKDGGTVLGLILIGGVFALIGLQPIGVAGLGVPTVLSLVFAIVQTVKAKRKLSWVALIFAILAFTMLVVVAVLTFAVDWSNALSNMSF